MVSISAHAFADHLSVDLGTACLGMLQFLEDEATGTFAHDESIAAGAEGTACRLGLVVTRGEGLHGVETTNTTLGDSSFGTATDDGVGFAQTDEVERIGQGACTGSAS